MSRTRWNILIVVLLIAGLAWIWVNRLPAGNASAAGALPPAPAVGHPAPDFTLTTAAGETFKLSDLRGTPVVLNFWATWCPPCRAELPELQAASQRLAGQVAIVGVDQAETPAEVQAFGETARPELPDSPRSKRRCQPALPRAQPADHLLHRPLRRHPADADRPGDGGHAGAVVEDDISVTT